MSRFQILFLYMYKHKAWEKKKYPQSQEFLHTVASTIQRILHTQDLSLLHQKETVSNHVHSFAGQVLLFSWTVFHKQKTNSI